jgi:hypothetical protein
MRTQKIFLSAPPLPFPLGQRRFGYKLPGYFMEYGPIEAQDLESARVIIRQKLGLKRLPKGMEVWDLIQRPLTRWVVQAS